MSATERDIKVILDLPGQHLELTRERPWGDNPAYYAWQVDEVLDEMKKTLRAMIAAEHGHQSVEAPWNA